MTGTATTKSAPLAFTFEELAKVMADLPPKPAVGIVVRPAIKQWLRRALPAASGDVLGGLTLSGIPIYEDGRQLEDCVPFYDHEALRKYLTRHE